MPRSKNPDNYSPTLKLMLETALKREDAVVLKLEDERTAMRIRQQVFAFINALERREKDSDLDLDQWDSRRYRSVKVSQKDNTLTLVQRKFDAEMLSIENQLRGLDVTGMVADVKSDDALQAELDAFDNTGEVYEPEDVGEDIVSKLFAGQQVEEVEPVYYEPADESLNEPSAAEKRMAFMQGDKDVAE